MATPTNQPARRRTSPRRLPRVRLSHCGCPKEIYVDQMSAAQDEYELCRYAVEWLSVIEQKTDQIISYQQSQRLYERVQKKESNQSDELQISRDIPRTFPEEPFFSENANEGRCTLSKILNTLSKHSSSAGYV